MSFMLKAKNKFKKFLNDFKKDEIDKLIEFLEFSILDYKQNPIKFMSKF